MTRPISSSDSGFSSEERSPGSLPSAPARTARRTIFAERVFGSAATQRIRSGLKAFPSTSVTALATRRFGWSRPLIGTASELVDAYGTLAERGVERVYTWFCDFAPPDMLAEFGEDVIAPLRAEQR